jgi:hypothetical protein
MSKHLENNKCAYWPRQKGMATQNDERFLKDLEGTHQQRIGFELAETHDYVNWGNLSNGSESVVKYVTKL